MSYVCGSVHPVSAFRVSGTGVTLGLRSAAGSAGWPHTHPWRRAAGGRQASTSAHACESRRVPRVGAGGAPARARPPGRERVPGAVRAQDPGLQQAVALRDAGRRRVPAHRRARVRDLRVQGRRAQGARPLHAASTNYAVHQHMRGQACWVLSFSTAILRLMRCLRQESSTLDGRELETLQQS